MPLSEDVRSAISNAYYENRGKGQTMETAADDATAAVMALPPLRDALTRGLSLTPDRLAAALHEASTRVECRAASQSDVHRMDHKEDAAAILAALSAAPEATDAAE